MNFLIRPDGPSHTPHTRSGAYESKNLPYAPSTFYPTSNHYGDSFIGFAVTIVIWSFALAAIYKSTRSVIACAIYHAFIDSIGAIYDWNLLFDSFPGNIAGNLYRLIVLIASISLWLHADRKE